MGREWEGGLGRRLGREEAVLEVCEVEGVFAVGMVEGVLFVAVAGVEAEAFGVVVVLGLAEEAAVGVEEVAVHSH